MLVEVEIYNEHSGETETGFINPNGVETAYPFKLKPNVGEEKSRDAIKLTFGSNKTLLIVASLEEYNLMCSSMMTQTGAILEQGRQHYHAQASRIINQNGVL